MFYSTTLAVGVNPSASVIPSAAGGLAVLGVPLRGHAVKSLHLVYRKRVDVALSDAYTLLLFIDLYLCSAQPADTVAAQRGRFLGRFPVSLSVTLLASDPVTGLDTGFLLTANASFPLAYVPDGAQDCLAAVCYQPDDFQGSAYLSASLIPTGAAGRTP